MINDHLTISDKGLQLLRAIETLRLQPYDDQTGQAISKWCKGATIGYGYLIPENEWPRFANGISKFHAGELLEQTLLRTERAIRRTIIKPLLQQQFDALVLLTFNIGIAAFMESSVAKQINDPCAVTRYPTLEIAWKAWNKSRNKENVGLINRRKCEWNIWQYGIYERW
ncbi:MAG: lysozyme [Methylobacter tundripaludum]|nr:lysozyme [Methylobacter tundripaludum]